MQVLDLDAAGRSRVGAGHGRVTMIVGVPVVVVDVLVHVGLPERRRHQRGPQICAATS
jgi:hypothetical protein